MNSLPKIDKMAQEAHDAFIVDLQHNQKEQNMFLANLRACIETRPEFVEVREEFKNLFGETDSDYTLGSEYDQVALSLPKKRKRIS